MTQEQLTEIRTAFGKELASLVIHAVEEHPQFDKWWHNLKTHIVTSGGLSVSDKASLAQGFVQMLKTSL